MFGNTKVSALVGEFLGTATIALVVVGLIYGQLGLSYFIAIAAGLALAAVTFAFGSVSGAHFNPIVTVGLWTVRKVETAAAILYIGAQMLGGFAAWQLSEFLLEHPLKNIAGDEFNWQVLTAEAVGAFIFTFILVAALTKGYDQAKTSILRGAGYSVGIIVAGIASTGVINPAVAMGIQSWSWAYAVGPIAGALVGVNLYALLFTESRPKAKSSAVSKPKTKAAKRGKK